MSNNNNQYHILASSTGSALLCSLCMIPFDVVQVRMQQSILLASQTSERIPNSIHKAFLHIVRKEGFLTLYNGTLYALGTSLGMNISIYFTYEHTQKYLDKNLTNKSLIPPIASIFSSTIGSTLIFPLEYWKTIQQAQVGKTTQSGFELGKKLYSAYSITIQRNNFVSGLIGGSVGGVFSQPFDVIQTYQQLSPELAYASSWKVSQIILKKQGFTGFFAGIGARLGKLMTYGCLMVTGYQMCMKLFSLQTPFQIPQQEEEN